MTIVQKYGGSSLSSTNKILKISEKIIHKVKQGNKIIVVLSAMGKTTNTLINLSKKICKNPDPRELDMLLTTGEQISVSLLTIALKKEKVKAISLNAFQAGIHTDSNHNNAKIYNFDKNKINYFLNSNDVIVITGFQGIDESKNLTTLGRGGSDTTAVALASFLEVSCEIYSDFPGIFTIDPKIFPKAKKLSHITYDEMLEMSVLGAKVLHSRSVEIAKKFNTKIYCGSTFINEEGTFVIKENIEKNIVTGLSVLEDQIQVIINNVPDHEHINKIFESIASYDLNVDMICIISSNNKLNVSFTIINDHKEYIDNLIKKSLNDFNNYNIIYKNHLSKISIVGTGMRDGRGVASRFFKSLKNINIMMVTTSEIKISALIENNFTKVAVNNLADEFEL